MCTQPSEEPKSNAGCCLHVSEGMEAVIAGVGVVVGRLVGCDLPVLVIDFGATRTLLDAGTTRQFGVNFNGK